MPGATLICSVALLPASAALAQDAALPAPQPVLPYDLSVASMGVSERYRPEYEPDGVSVGEGVLHPSLEVGSGYSDNVFSTRTEKTGDGFAWLRPGVEFRLGDEERFARVLGEARVRRYFGQTHANETGLTFDADASLPLAEGLLLQGGALARRAYERPGSGSFPAEALSPIEFDEVASYVRMIRSGSRVRVLAALDAARFDFKDARPALGGAAIDQNDRDRTSYRGTARVEWSASGGVSAFVEGSYSQLDYHRERRLDGTDNVDGARWQGKAGVLLTGGKLRGGLGAGYSRRTYDSAAYDDFSGFVLDASVQYFATGLTTFSLAARRSIEEGGGIEAGSFVYDEGEFRINHELLRNLILGAGVSYAKADYRRTDREDEIVTGRINLRYLQSRNIEVTAELGLTDRNSAGTVPGPRFDAVHGLIGVNFRL